MHEELTCERKIRVVSSLPEELSHLFLVIMNLQGTSKLVEGYECVTALYIQVNCQEPYWFCREIFLEMPDKVAIQVKLKKHVR